MFESFITDTSIFSNEFSTFIDTRNRPAILHRITEKHKGELDSNLDIHIKKNDLIIWNALYSKEIIRTGVSKKYLHPLYNDFYNKIHKANTLKELQTLEIAIANAYLKLLITEVEVKDNFIVNKILQYLHMNIESFVSLEDIANHLNITPQYAASCFKKHMGTSLMKYAKKIRVERAKILLVTTSKSIMDISFTLGFYDQSHFSRTFKDFEGVTPTEFRNTHYN